MKNKLEKLLNNAYAPYSKFLVSCVLITKDNKEFFGVNVENASYSSGICAERSAIVSAISSGYKKEDFKELHVMVSSGNISMPCFACRQVICEFFKKEAKVYCYSTTGEVIVHTVEELCPYPFESDDLV